MVGLDTFHKSQIITPKKRTVEPRDEFKIPFSSWDLKLSNSNPG
jgi:hypothetical protein